MNLIDITKKDTKLSLFRLLNTKKQSFIDKNIYYISGWPNEKSTEIFCKSLLKFNELSQGVDHAYALFDKSNEAKFPTRANYEQINKFVKRLQLEGKIIVASQTRSKWLSDDIAWVPYHHWPIELARHGHSRTIGDNHYERLYHTPLKFMCLNRTMRPHRYVFLAYASQSDWVEALNYSNMCLNRRYDWVRLRRIIRRRFPDFSHLAPEGAEDLRQLEREPPDLAGPLTVPSKWGAESHIWIVTETDFTRDCPRATEKSYKPFMYFRPSIIIGDRGVWDDLKSRGFRSFGGLIDESYDDEPDPNRRMAMICTEIDRLAKQLECPFERSRFLDGARETCAHNQALMQHGLTQNINEEVMRALDLIFHQKRHV